MNRTHVLPLAAAAAALLIAAGCGDEEPPVSSPASDLPVTSGPASAAATSSSATTSPATTSASPSATASPTGPQPCATSSLRVALGDAEGAAGSTYTALRFVNTGSATCTLSGHPGVSFVAGSDGEQVGASARRDGTPTRVTLAPGAQAHATLRITNAGNYDADECRPVQVRGFRVYPPDQTASVFVAKTETACSSASVVTLTISEVEAGAPTA